LPKPDKPDIKLGRRFGTFFTGSIVPRPESTVRLVASSPGALLTAVKLLEEAMTSPPRITQPKSGKKHIAAAQRLGSRVSPITPTQGVGRKLKPPVDRDF
jgi:hypothetical protein